MLTVHADHKLARDRDDRCDDGHAQRVRAQQQAERESGNPRTARIKTRELPCARADVLRQECRAKNGNRVFRRDLEIEPNQAVEKQRGQHRNLIVAWVLDIHLAEITIFGEIS